MKDCKCERRLSDPLDPPSEETLQRCADVVEHYLNMSRELNKKSKLPIEVTEEHIKIINRFMEESKTKKMTKAEAFEWLKCKKVRVSCRGINESVQSKLFTCGVQWMGGGTGFCNYGNYYVIDSHGLLGHCEGPYWENLINEEISADDILSIEIIEEKYEPEFNYDKAVELANPLMHYLSETGHTEVISVCKEGISAIPMGTFLYKG